MAADGGTGRREDAVVGGAIGPALRGHFAASVGDRIREARIAAGMTQADLAVAARMSKNTLSNMEQGRGAPPLLAVALIAHELDCTLDDLVPIDAIDLSAEGT